MSKIIKYLYNKKMTFSDFVISQKIDRSNWIYLASYANYNPRVKVHVYKLDELNVLEGLCYFDVKSLNFYNITTDKLEDSVRDYKREFYFIPNAIRVENLYSIEKEN